VSDRMSLIISNKNQLSSVALIHSNRGRKNRGKICRTDLLEDQKLNKDLFQSLLK
jgi:hypothetical protein